MFFFRPGPPVRPGPRMRAARHMKLNHFTIYYLNFLALESLFWLAAGPASPCWLLCNQFDAWVRRIPSGCQASPFTDSLQTISIVHASSLERKLRKCDVQRRRICPSWNDLITGSISSSFSDSSHNVHLGPYSTESVRCGPRHTDPGTDISIINYLLMTARITSCSSLVHSN